MKKKGIFFSHAITPGMPTMFAFRGLLDGKYPFDDYASLNPEKKGILFRILKELKYFTIGTNAGNFWAYINGKENNFDIMICDKLSYTGTKRKTIIKGVLKTFYNMLSYNAKKLLMSNFRIFKQAIMNQPIIPCDLKKILQQLLYIIEKQEFQQKPFAIWLHVMDCHVPYTPDWEKLKFLEKIILILKFWKIYTLYFQKFSTSGFPYSLDIKSAEEYVWNNKELSRIIRKYSEIAFTLYDLSIQKIDRILSKFINIISHKYENTYFFITSDHGECFGELSNLMFHKPISHNVFLNRVPLIIIGPEINAGNLLKSSSLISTIDIPATILDIVNGTKKLFNSYSIFSSKRNIVFSESIFWMAPNNPLRFHGKIAPYEAKLLITAYDSYGNIQTKLEGYDGNLPGSYPSKGPLDQIINERIKKIRARTELVRKIREKSSV